MNRWAVFLLALLTTACAGAKTPIVAPTPVLQFVQPKQTVVLVGMAFADIRVQLRVPRDENNRTFHLRWSGEGCSGAWDKTMDGTNEPAVMPVEPIVVRVSAGICEFVAAVVGKDDDLRGTARLSLDAR